MSASYCNPQLKTRYDENSSFRELMNSNHKKYLQLQQQSLYSDLSKVNTKFLQISSQFIDETNHNGSKIYSQRKNILYIYSHFQPQSPAELNKLFLYFIHLFPEPKEPFHLIYVNSTQGGKSKCWSTFKNNILQQLPLKYLLYMEKLVLIRPSFLDKASSIVQFGVQNKFFNGKLQKFDSLKAYFESIGKKMQEIKKSLPAEVIEDEEAQNVQSIVKVMPFFICNFNQNRTSYEATGLEQELSSVKKPQTTINSLSNQSGLSKIKQKKKGLQHYPSGELGIPLVLELLIFYFTQIPIRCQTEGLFRKCTSIDDEMLLIKELEKQHYEVLTALKNQIAVASILLSYLKGTMKRFLDSIISEIHSFPIINFMTLMHTLKFLRDYIIPHSKKNLMTLENVAICFAPCLMKSKEITQKEILLAAINVEITKLMLSNFQQIFGNSQKQKRISSKAYRIYRKNSKINEDSPQKKQNQQIDFNENIEIKVTPPIFSCPQDFLQPVSMILEDEKQSETEKLSERGSDCKREKFQKEEKQRYGQKKFSGITLASTRQPQQQESDMKKHKSYKRLPFPKQSEQENSRKSDTDKVDIDEDEDSFHIPNSQGVQRLNKLRVNRSRMGQK